MPVCSPKHAPHALHYRGHGQRARSWSQQPRASRTSQLTTSTTRPLPHQFAAARPLVHHHAHCTMHTPRSPHGPAGSPYSLNPPRTAASVAAPAPGNITPHCDRVLLYVRSPRVIPCEPLNDSLNPPRSAAPARGNRAPHYYRGAHALPSGDPRTPCSSPTSLSRTSCRTSSCGDALATISSAMPRRTVLLVATSSMP